MILPTVPNSYSLHGTTLMITLDEDYTDCSWGRAEMYFAVIEQNKGHYP